MLVTFSKYFERKQEVVFECLCAECYKYVALLTGQQLQRRLVLSGRLLCPDCLVNSCHLCKIFVPTERRVYITESVFICPVCDVEKGEQVRREYDSGQYAGFMPGAVESGLSIYPYLKKLTMDVTEYVEEIKAEVAGSVGESTNQKIPKEVK